MDHEDIKSKNISILFGAGAEQCLGVCTGKDFAMGVLGINPNGFKKNNEENGIKNLNEALSEHYRNLLESCCYSSNDFYSEFHNDKWKIKDLLEAAIRKKLLDNVGYENKKSYDSDVKSQLNSFFCGDNLKDCKQNEAMTILQDYASYMGIIDESFHTLIAPKVLGPQKFWRVVMCYARAYAYLLGLMLPICNNQQSIGKEDYKKIIEEPEYALQLMKDFADNTNKRNYYSILKKIKDEKFKDGKIKVVTTNYTTLCEHIAGMAVDNIAYIHGKFSWFESAKTLTVYDVENGLPPNDILFPYIFIQSGVKPIVDIRQLEEYGKMLGFMERSDYLIILGYRLNVDDNHINGIIRAQMAKGKKVIYFDFQEEKTNAKQYDKNSKDNILKRLRIFEEDVNKIGSNLRVIRINDNDCFDKFETTLLQIIDGKYELISH